MDIPLTSKDGTAQKSYLIRGVALGLFGGFCFYMCLNWVNDFLPGFTGPGWIRVGLLALPWLVLWLYLKIQRRVWREDELEILINRQTLVFAFWGLMIMVVVADQLQAAGWLSVFAWTRDRLVIATGVMIALGMGWTKSRYR